MDPGSLSRQSSADVVSAPSAGSGGSPPPAARTSPPDAAPHDQAARGPDATKFCIACGRSIPRAANFCPQCGVAQA